MSEANDLYIKKLRGFTREAKRAFEASITAKGLKAGGARYWASVLLTRICTISASLLLVCPGSVLNEKGANWDFESVAALSRSLFEAILMLFYLGLDEASEDEWDLRFLLLNLADCTERIRYFHQLGDSENVAWGVPTAVSLRAQIEHNPVFQALPVKFRKVLLTGERPTLFAKGEIIRRAKEDPVAALDFYRFLSNYMHFLPFGFHRTGIHQRDGTENEVDKARMAQALEFTANWLGKAVREFEGKFSDLVTFGRGSFDFTVLTGRSNTLSARDKALLDRIFSSPAQR